MGALPSRESQQHGFYSHRHGRNRRNEIILIPLTKAFFPSHDCPLFQHVAAARHRRTAKYYYRALRDAHTASHESDYFCMTTAVTDWEGFVDQCIRAGRREALLSTRRTSSPREMNDTDEPDDGSLGGGGCSSPTDYAFHSYSDTLEGLYQILVADNEIGMFETDQELREGYMRQVYHQKEMEHGSRFKGIPKSSTATKHGATSNSANRSSNTTHSTQQGGAAASTTLKSGQSPEASPFTAAPSSSAALRGAPDNDDGYLAGYLAGKRYAEGKDYHTLYQTFPSAGESGITLDPITTTMRVTQPHEHYHGDQPPPRPLPPRRTSCSPPHSAGQSSSAEGGAGGGGGGVPQTAQTKHVTSPAAYYIRPIPCAIVSRCDPNKPPPEDDPHYVSFQGTYVKVVGMFGVFPSTVGMRYKSRAAAPPPVARICPPRPPSPAWESHRPSVLGLSSGAGGLSSTLVMPPQQFYTTTPGVLLPLAPHQSPQQVGQGPFSPPGLSLNSSLCGGYSHLNSPLHHAVGGQQSIPPVSGGMDSRSSLLSPNFRVHQHQPSNATVDSVSASLVSSWNANSPDTLIPSTVSFHPQPSLPFAAAGASSPRHGGATNPASSVPTPRHSRQGPSHTQPPGSSAASDAFPVKEGATNGDDHIDPNHSVEQHLLKGSMFVDKDVGDQILGNVVMLAVHMYVRQCWQAGIELKYLPALPVFLRAPLSNIPMLQFIREFRVRLRSLLRAGTAKSGELPTHVGMSGFHPDDIAGGNHAFHPAKQRLLDDAFVWEEDVPDVSAMEHLFAPDCMPQPCVLGSPHPSVGSQPHRHHPNSQIHHSPRKHSSASFSYANARHNSPPPVGNSASVVVSGAISAPCVFLPKEIPVLMMSGFNVQATPLRDPLLNATAPSQAFTHVTGAAYTNALHQAFSTPNSSNSQNHHYNTAATTAGESERKPSFNGAAGGTPTTVAQGSVCGHTPTTSTTPKFTSPSSTAAASGNGAWTDGAAMSPEAVYPDAFRHAMLQRRKGRFRMWIEDGHLCVWCSAAYVRRACLLLAQQLNTTVDSDAVPEQREWRYVGLLRPGLPVPALRTLLDVTVVSEDFPEIGLFQGDVLRCSTAAEVQAAASLSAGAALPFPTAANNYNMGHPPTSANPTGTKQHNSSHKNASGTPGSASPHHLSRSGSPGGVLPSGNASGTSTHSGSPHPHPQSSVEAPAGSFWVRGAGGLDDSYINASALLSSGPIQMKLEKQQQRVLKQQQQQQQPTAGAAPAGESATVPMSTAATNNNNNITSAAASRKTSGVDMVSSPVTGTSVSAIPNTAAKLYPDINRCEGTLHLEEVILAWMKTISATTRDVKESDPEWVRDALHGEPVRVDRYVIRRLEHDGVRYFVGVTPRFIGQQRRLEERQQQQQGRSGTGGSSANNSPLLHSLNMTSGRSSPSQPPPPVLPPPTFPHQFLARVGGGSAGGRSSSGFMSSLSGTQSLPVQQVHHHTAPHWGTPPEHSQPRQRPTFPLHQAQLPLMNRVSGSGSPNPAGTNLFTYASSPPVLTGGAPPQAAGYVYAFSPGTAQTATLYSTTPSQPPKPQQMYHNSALNGGLLLSSSSANASSSPNLGFMLANPPADGGPPQQVLQMAQPSSAYTLSVASIAGQQARRSSCPASPPHTRSKRSSLSGGAMPVCHDPHRTSVGDAPSAGGSLRSSAPAHHHPLSQSGAVVQLQESSPEREGPAPPSAVPFIAGIPMAGVGDAPPAVPSCLTPDQTELHFDVYHSEGLRESEEDGREGAGGNSCSFHCFNWGS